MKRTDLRRLFVLHRDVYAKVPDAGCKGLCAGACGPIALTQLEAKRLREATGKPLRAPGGTCSVLREGRCSAYADRPLICRLFGVAVGLECPHGCGPSAKLSRVAAGKLLDRAREVGGPAVVAEIGEG